jgi:hypothetical protein
VVVGGLLLLIVITIVAGRSMRGTYAKSSLLNRSQRGIGVVNRRVDGHIREVKEWLIPLTMNDLLAAAKICICYSITSIRWYVRWHMAKMPQNIFWKPEFCEEEEEAPPLWVVWIGATAGGGEAVRWVLGSLGTVGWSDSCSTSL